MKFKREKGNKRKKSHSIVYGSSLITTSYVREQRACDRASVADCHLAMRSWRRRLITGVYRRLKHL